jgi:hypothetical protein
LGCKHENRKPHTHRYEDDAERHCEACKMKLWAKAIPRPLRFHDLRHSCATILLRAGVDIHTVQRILRHRSVTTTAGTYAHLLIDDLRKGMGLAFGAPEQPAEAAQAAVVGGASYELPDDEDPHASGGFRAGLVKESEGAYQVAPQGGDAIDGFLARQAGFEPTTHGLEGRCSVQTELLAQLKSLAILAEPPWGCEGGGAGARPRAQGMRASCAFRSEHERARKRGSNYRRAALSNGG